VSHPASADLSGILQALVDAGVEFILVGGAAAVVHGAPITTQDVDIVPNSHPENLDRLARVLAALDAVVRELSERRLRPTREHLNTRGQILLSTSLGPVDCLMTLHDGRGYTELLPHSDEVAEDTLRLKVLNLETLVLVKTEAGRAKDRIAVPILLALLKSRLEP
jgi:predicted nucleotidyltransferase